MERVIGAVTDELSGNDQGAVLCPACERGYLVVVKGENQVMGETVDCFHERCINGCGSELGSKKTVRENARIARLVSVAQMARFGRKWSES